MYSITGKNIGFEYYIENGKRYIECRNGRYWKGTTKFVLDFEESFEYFDSEFRRDIIKLAKRCCKMCKKEFKTDKDLVRCFLDRHFGLKDELTDFCLYNESFITHPEMECNYVGNSV